MDPIYLEIVQRQLHPCKRETSKMTHTDDAMMTAPADDHFWHSGTRSMFHLRKPKVHISESPNP